jgi:uncharacterized protein
MPIEKSLPAVAALGPVTERVALLDVLRGFAILGILLFNMFAFSGWTFLDTQQAAALPASSGDRMLERTMMALIEGKFYSLFSFLFGLGFAVMLERFKDRGVNPVPLLLRRYTALLAIGLVHAVFIWFGDILTLYALLGAVLLLFRRQSVRALVTWAVILLILPVVLYGLGLALLPAGAGISGSPAALPKAFAAFKSSTDYAQIVSGNIAVNSFNWMRRLVLMFYPRVFAMFLLGFALGKMRVFQAPARHAPLIRAVALSGVLVGLPASILYAAQGRHEGLLPLTANGFVRTIFESIGTPLLSLGYVAWTTLLFQSSRWKRSLLWLAPVGRTALSNYLLQSVACVLLFYGFGGGLFMRVSLATSLAIAVCLYTIEVVVSRLWLSQFTHGPLEWVWRQLTYWKRLPLRRAGDRAPAADAY